MTIINPKPQGKNGLPSQEAFNQRLNYKQKTFNKYGPVPIDMIYEKPYYGKVDTKGCTVYPSELNMEQLPGPGLILTHDFVAKAFSDLKSVVEFNIRSRTRRFIDIFPSGYQPKSATINFHEIYHSHFVDAVYSAFINNYILQTARKRRIRNFGNFVNQFVSYAEEIREVYPVSKTGFIMSRFCPHAISGLIIELETVSKDDDGKKYDGLISKPSFSEYVKLVSSFGFYVDKNYPWRIAVNLDHPKMTQKYLPSFGTSYENNAVFDDYFYRSEAYSYEDFKARMWNAYKELLGDEDTTSFGMVSKVTNCAITPPWADISSHNFKTTSVEGFLESISDDYDGKFQSEYPDSFFLPHYFKIRLSESRKHLSPRQYNAMVKNILRINKSGGIDRAIRLIEGYTKQSDIYMANKDSSYSTPIDYFGKNISSGLHSYKKHDKVVPTFDPYTDADRSVESIEHYIMESQNDHLEEEEDIVF
jgi:hypothetical protein